MTNEEWHSVENELKHPPGIVKMNIDGYNVTITHAIVKPMQYCIAVFINGVFEMKWVTEDTDIRRRFCSKHTKSMVTAKDKKKLNITNRELKRIKAKYTYDWYEPYWNSFRSMKSHFLKNNDSIELVKIGYGG